MAPLLPISSHFLVGQGRHGWRSALLVALWLAAGTGTALAQAPVLTGLSPTRNLRNAPRAANVAVTFSQPMSSAAASAGSVKVFSAQRGGRMSGAQGGTASVASNTITFNPTNNFRPGEKVFVTTTTAAQSSAGATLATGHVQQFTTAAGGTGVGNLQPHATNPTPTIGQSPFDLALADLDGDADLDLVSANVSTADITLRFNDGAGNLTPPAVNPSFMLRHYPASVVPADVDGDGDLDLLATNIGSPSPDSGFVSLRLNNGSGVFTAPATGDIHLGDIPGGLAVGDVDADGDLDFVTANFGNNNGSTASVRLNDGTGQFTEPATGAEVSVGLKPWKVVLADVDADGDLDLLTASFDRNAVSLRLNDGTGQFTAPATNAEIGVGTGQVALLLNDLDGDSDLDLVTINYADSTISRRFNDGAGVFSAPASNANMPVAGGAAGGTLADVDADGDLDLLVSSFKSAIVRVWRNDGSGNFTPPAAATGITTDGFNAVAMGDLDGDGDLDVVSANYTSTTVSVRLNQAVAPTITTLTPASGVVGAVVTIVGTNLTGATGVSFNGTAATAFTVNSPTQATATVPAGASTGPVTVTTPDGTSNGLVFTVLTAPVITALSPTRNLRNAPVSASAAITFDQTMSSATASAGSVKVFSAQRGGRMSGTQGGTASVSGNAITFNPSTDFGPGETLFVTTTTAAQSSAGANLAAGHVHQFTTTVGGTGQGNFLPPATNPNPAVGTYPLQVALGDVDGDGDLDVVTANNSASTASVRLNNGAGSFSGSSDPATGLINNSLTLGDVDGDGDLDLLAAVNTGGVVAVRLNNGSGSFSAHPVNPNISLGFTPLDVALGDVDGDGDLDFVTANLGNPGRVCLRLNDGTGNFTAPATNPNPAVASSCRTVKLGDIDGDGDLDLVTANQSSVSVRLNDGTGNFTGSTELGSPGIFWGLTLGDVDGDGDLDIAAGNLGAATVNLFLNDGAGTFTPPAANSSITLGASPRTITLADVDADGDLDLLTANSGNFSFPGTVSVRINDGTGSFTPQVANAFLSVGNGAVGLATGDVDGDGDVDLVTSNTGDNNVSVRLNQPLPPVITSFSPTSALVGTSVTITGSDFVRSNVMAVAFNGTAAPGFTIDSPTQITVIVPAGATTGPITLASPYGTGTSATPFTVLTTPVITALSPTRNLRNAPRSANVVITFDQLMSNAAASAGSVKVFSQQRGGRMSGTQGGTTSVSGNTITFNPSANFRPGETVFVTTTTAAQSTNSANLAAGYVHQFTAAAGVGPAVFGGGQDLTVSAHTAPALASGDVDGDGDADLVTINLASGPGTGVAVYLNDGTGTLAPHPTTPTSVVNVTSVQDMTLADLDGDGDLDLLIGQRNEVLIMTNDGSGVFPQAQSVAQPNDVNRVVVGDIDADGDLDAAVAVRNGALNVLRNDGSGTFTAAGSFSLGARVTDVAFGDLDADGDLDLVAAASGAGASGLVLRNDGTGTFGNATTLPGSRAGTFLADIDADGDLDLLTSTGGFSGSVSVQRNDGTGTFIAAHQTLAVGNTPEAVTTADFNGDGHLDLLIANTLSGTLSVRLNDGTGTFATTGPEITVGSQSRKPVAVDLDGDGDLDVLAAGLFNNLVITRFNQLLDLVVSTPQNVPGGLYNSVTVTGTGTATLTGPVEVVSFFTVQDGGVLNTNCQPITGAGSFTLEAGATLRICSPQGISSSGATGSVQVTGTRSFSSDATYVYNGTAAQVTGNGLPATVRALAVQNPTGATLTLPTSVTQVLRLDAGSLSTNEQPLTLRSTATRTAYAVHNGGSTSGAVTVQRFIGGATGSAYRHLSSPVQSTPVADLATPGFAPFVNPAYNAIPTPVLPIRQFPNVFGFDETRGGPVSSFILGYYSPTTLADELTPGRGWSVLMTGGRTPDFVGTLTTGNVTMTNLTRTGSFVANGDKSGWQLLGNPYPQPIDWDLATATIPAGMSASISVFRGTRGNIGAYLTRANGIGSLTDGLVPLGQGFFSRVTGTGPVDFTFTNALRVEANPGPVARPAVEDRPVVSLTLTDAQGQHDETFVYAEAGATPGPDDRFDGFKPGRNVGLPTLATLIGPDEAAVNGLPETVLQQPTTVELLAVLPTPGLYELRVGQLLNLGGVRVELLDRLAGASYDLAINPVLHLRTTQANEEIRGRFALVFNGQRVTGDNFSSLIPHSSFTLFPNPASGGTEVRVLGVAASEVVRLLDATGRVVRTSTTAVLNTRGLTAGVYVVRAGTRNQRLVVE